MKNCMENEFVLIAKHCPECGALVEAKRLPSMKGIEKLTERECSVCSWKSPDKVA